MFWGKKGGQFYPAFQQDLDDIRKVLRYRGWMAD
jgi:hypothetical protein